MIKKDPVTFLLIIMFLYPIIKGFLIKFSSKHLKNSMEGACCSVSFLISIFLGIYFIKKIFFQQDKVIYEQIYSSIPQKFLDFLSYKPIMVYIVVMPIVIFLIYVVIKLILNAISYVAIYPIIDSIEENIKSSSSLLKRIIGSLFAVPKAIIYVIIVTFILNFSSILNISENLDKHLLKSQLYGYIRKQIVIPVTNSKFAKNLPGIIDDSLKIVTKEVKSIDLNETINNTLNNNVIIYYNGVTLEEGVKSDEALNVFARKLVEKQNTTEEKGKEIYNWISKNITYDYEKQKKIFEDDFSEKSGAINTFNTRKGICFDFSCLYASMCIANGIKVRMITGEGFNTQEWVNHAWNQIYIPEKEKWINVDSTFSIAGDYFNGENFYTDHKNESIAGEW